VIVGGSGNTINGHNNAFIGGGSDNTIHEGCPSTELPINEAIIGGSGNTISASTSSVIVGGSENSITKYTRSVTIGGYRNSFVDTTYDNLVYCDDSTEDNFITTDSVIVGGRDNLVSNKVSNSIILGGSGNTITGNVSGTASYGNVIIGGRDNSVGNNINHSTILGGFNITATMSDYVYAPNMIVSTGGTDSRIGINTIPATTLHAVKNSSYLKFDEGAIGAYFNVIGTTTQMPIIAVGDSTKSVGIGVKGTSMVGYPGYGAQGDAHLYAGFECNGLNIVKGQGGTGPSYIRFFANNGADNTPDIHIQGTTSGTTTRGYVGINIDTPTERLDVNGNVKISGSLTKGSGTFRISNPTPNKDNYLYHSFVESPNAGDNIYRWSIEIINGVGSVQLPEYYHHLNENSQIWVNPVEHFGIGYGKIIDNNLEVHCNSDGIYNILLIGTRKDEIAVTNWKGVERDI